MSNYRKFIATKAAKLEVPPSLVQNPIPGREDDMVPTGTGGIKAGGMKGSEAANVPGYAFKSSEINQYKRWLVFGSAGSTMYASSNDITLQNLEVVTHLLSTNYKLALDILQDFSVRNVVKGQKTLLTVLSLALAYDDKTVRIYENVDMNKLKLDDLVNETATSYTFSDTVHRVSLSNDRSVLYAMVYDKGNNGNYRYEAYSLRASGELTKLQQKPTNLKWHENAIKPGFDGKSSLVALNYSLAVKRYASEIAPSMIRQSSMLFELVANIHAQRGWGAMVHKMVENFYNSMDNSELAQQFIKYGTRQQWSHKNLLRKVKPATMYHKQRAVNSAGNLLVMSQVIDKEDLYIKRPVHAPDIVRSNIFAWSVDKYNALENVDPSKELNARGYIADPLTKLWAADAMKAATTAKEVAQIVTDYQMPREAVERANTIWLKDPLVWEALLPHMPGNALVRNLRNMAEIGLLTPMSEAEKTVVDRLMNMKYMGRVHPIQVIQAAVTYDVRVFKNSYGSHQARTRKGGSTSTSTKDYTVSQPVVNALNVALHNSYKNIVPTNKRITTAVDISGSMYWNMLDNFFPFFPGEAAGIMALIFAHIESRYMPTVFSDGIQSMKLGNTSTIDDVLKELRDYPAGSTNLGLPVQHALNNKIPIDAFVVITDNEVNTGYHAASLMKKYRSEMGLPESKYITIAMQANGITVADPNDPFMLDVEGCSADTHDIVTNYIRGEF